MMNPKRPPVRDAKYLAEVREMECCVTATPGPSDPAHIRYGLGGGMGMKPGDDCVLPLKHDLHQIQHQVGEVVFWAKYLPMNPDLLMKCVKAYARELYRSKRP